MSEPILSLANELIELGTDSDKDLSEFYRTRLWATYSVLSKVVVALDCSLTNDVSELREVIGSMLSTEIQSIELDRGDV